VQSKAQQRCCPKKRTSTHFGSGICHTMMRIHHVLIALLLLLLQQALRHPGDYLLSQLDLCCPKLRLLYMPGLVIDGRGIKLAAGALPRADAAAAAGVEAGHDDDVSEAGLAVELGGAVGGLRTLQSVELCATQLMRSTVSTTLRVL
jgi:hypothetical protein